MGFKHFYCDIFSFLRNSKIIFRYNIFAMSIADAPFLPAAGAINATAENVAGRTHQTPNATWRARIFFTFK